MNKFFFMYKNYANYIKYQNIKILYVNLCTKSFQISYKKFIEKIVTSSWFDRANISTSETFILITNTIAQ